MSNHFYPWLAGLAVAGNLLAAAPAAPGFTGRIEASLTRGGETQTLDYTVGTNCLRIEPQADGKPNPVDLLDRKTGALTLLFPHNRSFVRLQHETTAPPAASAALPPLGRGAPTAGPGSAAMPLPMVPPMLPMPPAELKATGQTTNLLGCPCAKYEIKQRGEVMELWATKALVPFQPYRPALPPRVGPERLEEQWGELLQARNLFPLQGVLRLAGGQERLRFVVTRVQPATIADQDGTRFAPPADYHELQPLPF